MKWSTRGVLLGLVVLAMNLGACAYYNGFYNAKKAFREGEEAGKDAEPENRPTSAQKSSYNVCIRKCLNLLEEYPDSDLVDDALFLLGKTHYRMRNYRESVRYLDNVLVNFPASEFNEEAQYLKSLAHLALGEEAIALDQFRLLRERYPEGDFSVEALYRLGDTFRENERYDDAATYYSQYLTAYPDDEAYTSVQLALADVYNHTMQSAQAESILALVDEGRASDPEYFDAQLERARALEALERYDEALAILDDIEGESRFFKKRAGVLLLRGAVHLALGNEEEGKEILDGVALEFEAKGPEALARWRLASYYLRTYGPSDENLLEQLEIAVGGRMVQSEAGTQIRTTHQRVQEYRQLKESFDPSDSLAYQAEFQLAELLFTELNRPVEALEHYQRVLELSPESALAPRAAYAVGFIQAEHVGESESEATFAMLRSDYPESVQALALDGAVFLEPKPREYVEVVEGDEAVSPGAEPRGRGPSTPDSGRSLRRGGPGATTPRTR